MRILYIQVAITTKEKAAHYDKKEVRKRPVNEEKGIKIGKKGEK
jgi:hypothetical protein